MSAPCVVDTCSMLSLIDPVTRKLKLDVRLDPAGGLKCGNDANENAGLGINLSENCGQLLSLTAAGQLLARGSVYTHFASVGSFVEIAHSTTPTQIQEITLPNPFDDCEAQALVFGRFETRFRTGTDTPNAAYRAHLLWTMRVNGSTSAANGSAGVHQHIGGGDSNTNDDTDQWDYFIGAFRWDPSIAKTFTIEASHFDTNELINLATNVANTGGQSYINVLALPLSNTAF